MLKKIALCLGLLILTSCIELVEAENDYFVKHISEDQRLRGFWRTVVTSNTTGITDKVGTPFRITQKEKAYMFSVLKKTRSPTVFGEGYFWVVKVGGHNFIYAPEQKIMTRYNVNSDGTLSLYTFRMDLVTEYVSKKYPKEIAVYASNGGLYGARALKFDELNERTGLILKDISEKPNLWMETARYTHIAPPDIKY